MKQLELGPGEFLLDRYRVESVIGAGGMATVYKCTDTRLDLTVAVKVLRPHFALKSDVVKRFMLEAKLQARLNHPNIVNVSNVEAGDGQTLMVMEYLKGMSLADYASAKGGLSESEALDLMLPIADAVAMAHEQEVVHRDLKPSNIFLAETKGKLVPKLMDFGVAREQDSSMTATTTLLGTLPYMSFELVQSARNASPASDVYALAVTIFELITGTHPIPAKTLQEYVFTLMGTDSAPALRSVRPDASEALDALLQRALAKEKEARFSDATALARAIRELPADRSTAGANKPSAPPTGRDAGGKPEGLLRLESTYDVQRELGNGPVAIVYACAAEGATLAVKVLKPDRALDPRWNGSFVEAAQRQAAVAQQTPYVQPVHAVHPEFPGVATVRPNGNTLEALLESYGRFELKYTIELFLLLTDALRVAHGQGLLHGHFHPGNVFLVQNPDGVVTPQIMDFGQLLVMDATEVDALGHTIGYLAPELGGSIAKSTSASDIYSLGHCLFAVLTGHSAVRAGTLSELQSTLGTMSSLPDARSLDPSLPADLCNVLGWCLSLDPSRRYHRVDEVHRDLLAVRKLVSGY